MNMICKWSAILMLIAMLISCAEHGTLLNPRHIKTESQLRRAIGEVVTITGVAKNEKSTYLVADFGVEISVLDHTHWRQAGDGQKIIVTGVLSWRAPFSIPDDPAEDAFFLVGPGRIKESFMISDISVSSVKD